MAVLFPPGPGPRPADSFGRATLRAGERPAVAYPVSRPAEVPVPDLEPGAGGPEEKITFTLLADLPGVEIMTGRRSSRLFQVLHRTYSICVVPREGNDPPGFTVWRYRTRKHVAAPGSAMLMEPGEVHVNERTYGSANFFVVFVDPSRVLRMAEELRMPRTPHLRCAQTLDPQLLHALQSFYATTRAEATPLERETLLSTCLRVLFDRCGEQSPRALPEAPHSAARRARDYIHAHFLEPIHLADLEVVAGLSRFHLVRCFTRAYGLPPHAYQTQLRVAAVQDALRRGVRLAEIEGGFSDQSHMGRHFKRIVGLSPGQYAAAVGRRR